MSGRRIAVACMTPAPDTHELGELRLPSYGIRRILAAVVADPLLADSSVGLVDFGKPDTDAYVDAIMRLDPDLVGLSIYVWSMACMVEVARRIKRQRPRCTIVFGGPSACPAMFGLPLFAGAHQYLDAVVTTEGEGIFRDIARLPELSRTSLRSVLGLHLPANGAWLQTGHRSPTEVLDEIASPFRLDLMPAGSVAYLESYRGCPLSCRFCEWGASETARAVFSSDYIERELHAFARHGAPSVFLLDAGLNPQRRHALPAHRIAAHSGASSCGFWGHSTTRYSPMLNVPTTRRASGRRCTSSRRWPASRSRSRSRSSSGFLATRRKISAGVLRVPARCPAPCASTTAWCCRRR